MKLKTIKRYTNEELKIIKLNIASMCGRQDNGEQFTMNLIDEIIRLREYEWKYKELSK